MNLKSKLFGFGAASLLALSMTTGVMAQEGVEGFDPASHPGGGHSVSAGTKVELKEGICSLGIARSSTDFGKWEWDGGKYIGNNTGSVTLSIQNQKYKKTCTVNTKADNLNGKSHNNRDVIPASSLTLTNPGPHTLSTNYKQYFNIAAGGVREQQSTLTLSVPDVKPDKYEGAIYFQLIDGLN